MFDLVYVLFVVFICLYFIVTSFILYDQHRTKNQCFYPKKYRVHIYDYTRTITGRSRRRVITYYKLTQNICIDGKIFTVTGADESWLEQERTKLLKEHNVLHVSNNLEQELDFTKTWFVLLGIIVIILIN